MINAENFCGMMDKLIIFSHTLNKNSPYEAVLPRNHESIFFVTEGSLLYSKKGIQAVVPKGQVGYIAKGSVDLSGPYMCESVSYIAINFGFDENSNRPLFDTLCSKGLHHGYERIFREAQAAYSSDGVGQKMVATGKVLQILGMLLDESEHSEVGIKQMQKIKKGMEKLTQSFSSPELRVSDMAEASQLSVKQFRRIFFGLYGKNPYEYLQEYRIERAKILLENTGSSITEVSEACGFSDVYGFSHSFKRATGFSPADYQKRD